MNRDRFEPKPHRRFAPPLRAGVGAVALALALLALAAVESLAQGGVWQSYSAPGVGIQTVAPGDSGEVLLATSFGGFAYDGLRLRKLPIVFAGRDSFNGFAILRARNGDVWLGTFEDGLFRLAPDGTVSRFTEVDGVGNSSTDEIFALAETPDGRVWAATNGGGLSVYDGAVWSTFTTDQGLPSMNVTTLTVDPRDGSVWAGCLASVGTGGLAHVVGTTVTAYTGVPSVTGNVHAVLVTSGGRVWIGYDDGIAELVGSSFVAVSVLTAQVRSLVEGPHGELWCGSRSRGLGLYDAGVLTFFPSSPAGNAIEDMFGAASGVLWMATPGGLMRFEGGAWMTYRADAPLPQAANVLSVARDASSAARGDSLDRSGVTWFGMTNSGEAPVYVKLARRANGRLSYLGVNDGLPGGPVYALENTGQGGVWVGTGNTPSTGSVARVGIDGIVNLLLGPAEGLPAVPVTSLRRDGSRLWIGTMQGVAMWESVNVRFLPTSPTKVPDAPIVGLDVDSNGRLWIATGGHAIDPDDPRPAAGLVRFDPADSSYLRVTRANGMPTDSLTSVSVFSNGDVWIGTHAGAARWRDGAISVLSTAQGLPTNAVQDVVEGEGGLVWIATRAGLAAFDGSNVSTFTLSDGLAANQVFSAWSDAFGLLLACSQGGVSMFHPDRTAPRARILPGNPPVTGSGVPAFVVEGGDPDAGERDLRLAYQFDDRPRSPFLTDLSAVSPTSPEFGAPLTDGDHVLRLWAKDRALNETPEPFEVRFTVDANPPRPVLSSPAFNDVVKGTVPIVASIADARFERYQFEIRREGAVPWDTLLVSDVLPVPPDTVFRLDTAALLDGPWELRVGVFDSLGLFGYASATVIVDNLEPSAGVTSPARIDHVQGGRVFTTNGEAELYVPPNAFPADQIVRIDPLVPPDTLIARNWLAAWLIRANDTTLDKTGTLTLRRNPTRDVVGGGDATDGAPQPGPLHVMRVLQDGTLVPVGGSTSSDGLAVTTAIDSLGAFALLFGPAPSGSTTFSGPRGLDCQPRVVSPQGGGFDTRVAISFELARTTSAAVKVFDKAGRLVKEVSENDGFAAGRNVVFWDGRDGDGEFVPSGLYMVAVKAEGETAVKSVAVANR